MRMKFLLRLSNNLRYASAPKENHLPLRVVWQFTKPSLEILRYLLNVGWSLVPGKRKYYKRSSTISRWISVKKTQSYLDDRPAMLSLSIWFSLFPACFQIEIVDSVLACIARNPLVFHRFAFKGQTPGTWPRDNGIPLRALPTSERYFCLLGIYFRPFFMESTFEDQEP